MQMRKRNGVIFLLLLVCFLCLTGCGATSAEELYSLPKARAADNNLQTVLSGILDEGYNYLAPVSGSNQEPVQRADLDGDGTDEILVFLQNSGAGALQVDILEADADVFSLSAVVECSGNAFGSVEYCDMSGDGGMEVLVTCQVSDAVTQAFTAFSFEEGSIRTLLSQACSRYALLDLNGDKLQDICLLTDHGDAGADITCCCVRGGIVWQSSSTLGCACGAVTEIRNGTLVDGTQVILFEENTDTGSAYEFFTLQGELLTSITPEKEIASDAPGGPRDVDGDGDLEFPIEVTAFDGAVLETKWCAMNDRGKLTDRARTLGAADESWYFILPDAWGTDTKVELSDAEEGMREIRFLDNEKNLLMELYLLEGSDRRSDAESGGYMILYSDSEKIVAMDADSESEGISLTEISEYFHTGSAPEE